MFGSESHLSDKYGSRNMNIINSTDASMSSTLTKHEPDIDSLAKKGPFKSKSDLRYWSYQILHFNSNYSLFFRFLHLLSSVSFDHWWYKMLKIFYIFWKQNKVVCIFHLSAQVIYRRERWPLQKIWILRNKKLHLHVIMCAYRHLQTPVAINVIIYFL